MAFPVLGLVVANLVRVVLSVGGPIESEPCFFKRHVTTMLCLLWRKIEVRKTVDGLKILGLARHLANGRRNPEVSHFFLLLLVSRASVLTLLLRESRLGHSRAGTAVSSLSLLAIFNENGLLCQNQLLLS